MRGQEDSLLPPSPGWRDRKQPPMCGGLWRRRQRERVQLAEEGRAPSKKRQREAGVWRDGVGVAAGEGI